jgi:hypothetical protein
VLKLKVLSLTEAEKGQAELRKVLAAKDAELMVVRREVAEGRRSTDADYLRGKLRNAEADLSDPYSVEMGSYDPMSRRR